MVNHCKTQSDDEIEYQVIDSEGTQHTGTLSQGKACLADLPLGACSIEYVPKPVRDKDDAELIQLRQQFNTALDGLIAEIEKESKKEDDAFAKENMVVQFLQRRWARLEGLYQGAESAVLGLYELARFIATQYGEAYSALFSISQHIATGNIDAIKQDLETLLAHTESQYAGLQEAFALLQDIDPCVTPCWAFQSVG